MKNFQGLILVCPAVLLTACAAPSATFQHSDGRIVQCQNLGWGAIGTAQALIENQQCVSNAQARGFSEMKESAVRTEDQIPPISLPDGWINTPPPKDLKDATAYARNPQIGAYLYFSKVNKKKITDIFSYVEGRKQIQAGKLRDPIAGGVNKNQVKGNPSYEFEVSGFSLISGQKLTFLVNVIDAGSELLYLTIWLPSEKYEGIVKSEVKGIPLGINFL